MEVKIKLNDMKYRYDVYQMFNIYFPLDEIKFLDDGDYIVNILDGKIEFKYGEYYNESKILENIKEDNLIIRILSFDKIPFKTFKIFLVLVLQFSLLFFFI